MTVRGPIDPGELGFTLPHEHTQIHLWQIPDRWDYWELRADEDLILEELRDFRRRGGATLRLGPLQHDAAWLALEAFLGRPIAPEPGGPPAAPDREGLDE